MLLCGYLLGVLLLASELKGSFAAKQKTIKIQRGQTAVLSCPIDVKTCGELHSLNWFKGDTRIAVRLGNGTNIAADYRDRVSIKSSEGPTTSLIINAIKISDEDVYTCDPTFYIPQETCESSGGYRIELIVTVPPAEVVMLDAKGEKIANGSIYGPMQEEQLLTATCVAKRTRPPPDMAWFRNNKRITSNTPTVKEEDGDLYTSSLELSLVLTRHDLRSKFECRVITDSLSHSVSTFFELELHVRPTQIAMTGLENDTVQGKDVLATCKVTGAIPAADVMWRNDTEEIDPDLDDDISIEQETYMQDDGTITTVSKLHFKATRFENDVTFHCEGENEVMRKMREKAIRAFQKLVVFYPPVVRVSPPSLVAGVSQSVLLQCEYEANPAALLSVKWYRNGEVVNVNESRFLGGVPGNAPLSIRTTKPEDRGNYTCELTNSVDTIASPTEIELDVQYVPVVEVVMVPDGPVKEDDETNVTLYCNIVDANPATLQKVRWNANSTLLKELPDCNETSEDLCHVDPSKLLLESIGRGFFFNYSCEGYNSAGWGLKSPDKELVVYYKPGPATLSHYPLTAIKKKSVTFSCSVDDPGYPEANRFHWMRGGRGPLMDVVTKDWTLDPVGLDSRTNFSCYAYNDGGRGASATVELDVHAPPLFIKSLLPYTGVLHSDKNANLSCRVECVPRCSITWYKDSVEIDPDSDRYYINETYLPAEPATGDFESVLSVLHFNMSAWPNQAFDIHADSANYSCVSSNNSVGNGVRSATYLSIEYKPTNTTVSNTRIDVVEGSSPGRILCSSKANPEPTYEWKFKERQVTPGSTLIINTPMTRDDGEAYTCVASNKHGIHTAETYINIQYRPSCNITRSEIDDEDALVCTADGNPKELDFSWYYKSENDTVYLNKWKVRGDSSYLILDDFSIMRTYSCKVNNSVGTEDCHTEVAGHLAWWQRWDRTTLIILIASIAAVLIAVIIICIIIICICRRRRRQEKYHTDASISATQSVLSYQPSSPVPPSTLQNSPEVPKSPPKWPLRPGVMVHVKGDTKQNLCATRLNTATAIASSDRSSGRGVMSTVVATIEHNSSSTAGGDASEAPGYGKGRTDKRTVRINPHNTTFAGGTHLGRDEVPVLDQDDDRPPTLPRRNIMTSKNSTNSNDQSASSANELLPKKRRPPNDISDEDDNESGIEQLESRTVPPNSGLFEKIFGEIFTRQRKTENDPVRHQWRFFKIFSTSRVFGRQRLDRSDSSASNPFSTKHRIKGIRCSGSVVTYKKTPVLDRPALVDSNRNALLGTSEIAQSSESDSTKQIHAKSSTLGDPLTEPGEYENLPFHGLQTAPNKFTTTPINFNNTNVVRVAPRPKLISNSQHQQYQIQPQTLKQSYSTISPQTMSMSSNNSLKSTVGGGGGGGGGGLGSATLGGNQTNKAMPNSQVNYNLSTCFPTSYTEYYHQQQKQCSAASAHAGNSFVNYPYTVENTAGSVVPANNPFIANSLKKFNTSGCHPGGHRKKPPESDKKFYSLKSLGHKKGLHFCSIKPSMSIASSSRKCKRHHSFAGGGIGDVVSDGPTHTLPYMAQSHKMNFYEPPLYENLTDSIQIHESSVSQDQSEQHLPYKKHHQHQHQLMDDYNNLMEAERLSIYRSDSGISNSSYECITPIPAPRQVLVQKTHSAKCKGNPVYMNVTGGGGTTAATSPSNHLHQAHSIDSCPLTPNNPNCKCNNNNGNDCSSHCDGANSASHPNNNTNREKQHPHQHGHHQRSSSNRKSKKRTQSSASLMSLERAPNTNPFLAGNSSSSGCASGNSQGGGASSSSSTSTVRCQQQQQQQHSYHQQQMLVPKELFPSSSISSQPGMANPTNQCSSRFRPSSSAAAPATNYSSDNSLPNTNPSKRKTCGYVIRPMKLPLRKHHSFHFQPSQTVAGAKMKNKPNYKQNGGPLVFKPFLNEKSAFKPISPAGANSCSRSTNNGNSVSTPRICGTSLKRHMSNVETYDSNRYSGTSASNSRLNAEEELSDDEEIDEIIITQEEDLPSSSSNSTVVGKRLMYADLASLSSSVKPNSRNPRCVSHAMTNTSDNPADEFDDLTINSDSEQLRRSNRLKPIPYPGKDFRNYTELDNEDEIIVTATPTKRATQYATLKFNEPLGPASFADDLDYADVDYRSYGPINYKAASIYALVKKEKNNGALKEVK